MLSRWRRWWRFRQSVAQAGASVRAARPAQAGIDRDVVLVPCYRRPEFLWHCLDNLVQADGVAGLHLVFRPDTGFDPENLEVIDAFADRLPSFEIQYPIACPYRRSKQSANVLLGYLAAAAVTRQYVFMIEEDIMVARDFFRWHRAVHASDANLYCSIGVDNPNRRLTLAPDPEGYYLSSGDYCSLGVCFDRRVLLERVARHVNIDYFSRPKAYVRRQFPASTVALGYTEQDGLLRRIQEAAGAPIAFPCVPRAFHAGFYGYHRAGGLSGTLQERVRALGQIIYSVEGMRDAAVRPEFVADSVPVNLDPPRWQTQRQIEVPR